MKFASFYTYPNFTIAESNSLEKIEIEYDPIIFRSVIYTYDCIEGGWQLRISKDGLIQISINNLEDEILRINKTWEDFSKAESFNNSWSNYLKILNLVYFSLDCCMHSEHRNISFFEYRELMYSDILRITYDSRDIPYRQTQYGTSGGGGDINGYMRLGVNRENKITRTLLAENIFKYLCSYYLESLLSNTDYIQLVSLVSKVLSEYNKRNWAITIVMCWFIIEGEINMLWDNLLKYNAISGNRKKSLEDKDFTISIKIEVLQINGYIDEILYLNYSRLRKSRNRIAHEFIENEGNMDDARLSLELSQKILENRTGLKFPFSTLGYPVHGL